MKKLPLALTMSLILSGCNSGDSGVTPEPQNTWQETASNTFIQYDSDGSKIVAQRSEMNFDDQLELHEVGELVYEHVERNGEVLDSVTMKVSTDDDSPLIKTVMNTITDETTIGYIDFSSESRIEDPQSNEFSFVTFILNKDSNTNTSSAMFRTVVSGVVDNRIECETTTAPAMECTGTDINRNVVSRDIIQEDAFEPLITALKEDSQKAMTTDWPVKLRIAVQDMNLTPTPTSPDPLTITFIFADQTHWDICTSNDDYGLPMTFTDTYGCSIYGRFQAIDSEIGLVYCQTINPYYDTAEVINDKRPNPGELLCKLAPVS